MATEIYTTLFQLKRGTAQRWETLNPVLLEGEPGYETDAGGLKIGDGKTAWKELEYLGGSQILMPQHIMIFLLLVRVM